MNVDEENSFFFFWNNPNDLDDFDGKKRKDLQDTEISPDADTGNDPIKLSTPITIPPVFQSPWQKVGAIMILMFLDSFV